MTDGASYWQAAVTTQKSLRKSRKLTQKSENWISQRSAVLIGVKLKIGGKGIEKHMAL